MPTDSLTPLPVAEAEGGMGEETQGASFGPGSHPSDRTPSGSAPAGFDPSRTPWQPIATAPKDGTKICLAEFHDGGRYPEEARWDFWTDYWRKYLCPGEGFGQPKRPSHWIPLPLPPAQGTEARSDEMRSSSAEGDGPVVEGHAPDDLPSRLTAAEAARDEALKERDLWKEYYSRATSRAFEFADERDAALSRAERAEKALLLIANGRCGACKRPNGVNACTLSDGEGGPGCGDGRRCFYETVDAEETARAALVQPAPTEDGSHGAS